MVACAGTTCGGAFRAIRSEEREFGGEAIRTQSTTQQEVDGHSGEVNPGPRLQPRGPTVSNEERRSTEAEAAGDSGLGAPLPPSSSRLREGPRAG